MKKTMTRLLSLMLALVLVVSAVPAVLAVETGETEEDGEIVNTPVITISGPTTGVINTPVELTATVSNVEDSDYSISWSGGGVSANGSKCTVTSTTAGNISVTATLKVGENEYTSSAHTVTFEKMTIVPSVSKTEINLGLYPCSS